LGSLEVRYLTFRFIASNPIAFLNSANKLVALSLSPLLG
jgi:hypothetical protein